MPRTNFKELLDAGVHFGHLKRKWNPAMAPYIFMERNGIHIIDLEKTIVKLDEAASAMKHIAKSGKKVLFVATKKQAKEIVSEKVKAGVHIFNPVPNSLRRSFLPSSIRAGAGIELSKVLYAGVEAEMSTMEKLIIRTGFEYEAFTKIWLRGGFSSENASFTFGTGYLFKSIKLDLGFATHDRLGVTSSVSLIFKIQ